MKQLQMSFIKKSDYTIEAMTLTYVPNGTATTFRYDNSIHQDKHNLPVSIRVIQNALQVELSTLNLYLHIPSGFPLPNNSIQGASGSGIMTVAFAAALLGDPFPTDVCMTGTIEPNGRIGPIGGASDKIQACKDYKGSRFIIPSGQTDAELIRRSTDTGVKVIEVTTLAEAYEAVTGKPLRTYAQR